MLQELTPQLRTQRNDKVGIQVDVVRGAWRAPHTDGEPTDEGVLDLQMFEYLDRDIEWGS